MRLALPVPCRYCNKVPTYIHGQSRSAERAGMEMRRSCAANSGPTRCADGRWLAHSGLSRLFLNIVEVSGGEKARCGVPKHASSVRNARHCQRGSTVTKQKSRWDRGWWIMMDDDHGNDQSPRVESTPPLAGCGTQALVHPRPHSLLCKLLLQVG
jgi:hypothetical protein